MITRLMAEKVWEEGICLYKPTDLLYSFLVTLLYVSTSYVIVSVVFFCSILRVIIQNYILPR